MNKVFVSGVGGWIGSLVAASLRARGYTVIGLDRPGTRRDHCDSFLEFELPWPAHQTPGWCLALEPDSIFIHCAGHVHRPVETPEEIRRFFAINRDGTQQIVAACEKTGVRRMLYVSTIAIYDWQTGIPADEEASLSTPTAYARSKWEGELAVRKSQLDGRVVRLATVFGPGDRSNFAKLASALKRRRFCLPGSGSARKSVIPVQLAAELIVRFAAMEAPPHRLINLALPQAPSLREIVSGFAAACGFKMPPRVPLWLLAPASKAGDVISLKYPNISLTSRNLKKLTEATTVATARMEAVFGRESWGSFSEWLMKAGQWYREL